MKLELVSAPYAPPNEAYAFAGIPLIDRVPALSLEYEGDENTKLTVLQSWQSCTIARLLRQVESPLVVGILADGCELGKTLTPLEEFGASLIVISAKVIPQWVHQIDHFFGTRFQDLWLLG